MFKFDTKVQHLKYRVLREVARAAWNDTLQESLLDIPEVIAPGKTPTVRCCIYKERAIVNERVKLAMGMRSSHPGVIEVIEIACDECPGGGYEVTSTCRGCLAHRCEQACKRGAISFDNNHVAHIDKSKCVECGACAKVCPFTAIVSHKRPCVNACKIKATSINKEKAASIDHSKCISCGACVYQCPFGAIVDRSYILNVIDMIKKSENNTLYKTYAIVAPSIASQFTYTTQGKIITAIRKLGFYDVAEVAVGAYEAAMREARELSEKGFLASSCCPAFVDYIEKNFPELLQFVSHTPSPMALTASMIKEKEPDARVVFIGPCTAKKMEAKKENVAKYVDAVITFEELQALIASKSINVDELEEGEYKEPSSYYGRVFARSGGLGEALGEALRAQGIDLELKPQTCNGIEECRIALLKKKKGILNANFIEGMACVGGCIGGAGCLTHGDYNDRIFNENIVPKE